MEENIYTRYTVR